MPEKNDGPKEITLSLKAFALSMARMIAEDPSIIDIFDATSKKREQHLAWMDLKEQLADPVTLARFSENISWDTNRTEWTELDQLAKKWAQYGWVIGDNQFSFDLWKKAPQSPQEADKIALQCFKGKGLKKIWQETLPNSSIHKQVFREACSCFENRCYTASASLLISLIDGTITSSKANTKRINRKTGSMAQEKVTNEMLKDETYRLPGYFHWELINLDSYIRTLFEHANNFTNEPTNINRNFLHHGMSKRKVLRKDCVKLFLAYKQVLLYCKHM